MQTAVLVTGGAGFIGSHACKALRASGYLPVVLDNLSTGHVDAVRFGPFVKGDVRDIDLVASALSDHACAAVMHFAASAYVGESVVNPGLYYDNNLGSMTALLKACVQTATRHIVFSSSCATYGVPERMPIRETTPQRPINPYGRTKLICEWMLADHSVAHGIRYAALRYFNAAGADPEGELSERHDPETHLIPLALRAASGHGKPLRVFGSDYPTPDGTCVRDYIHVVDLAEAHVLALQHLMDGGGSIALNLGTGSGHSIREIIGGIEKQFGRTVPTLWEDRRPGDPPELVADPAEAERVLGFRARRSDLTSLLSDAAPSFGLTPIAT